MTFLPNIPQPGDFLSVSQGNLLTNFQALDTSFDVDHTTFSNTTANNGKHAQVTLFEVQADPTLTFPESMLYSKNTGSNPNRTTDIYYATKPETGIEQILQLTNLPLINLGPGSNPGTAGGDINYVDTPWGFRIYYGTTATHSGGSYTVVLPVPYTTTILGNVMAATASSSVNCSALEGNTGLSIFYQNSVSAYWFMMGRL